MHILNTKTKVCDSNEAQSVLSLPAMYFKSVPNFENTKIYIPANYYSSISGSALNNNHNNKGKGNKANDNNVAGGESSNKNDIQNDEVEVSMDDPAIMNSSAQVI